MLRAGLWAALALGIGAAVAAPPREAPVLAREHAVKAGFIYNFTKFVEWPAESFAAADAPFVIAVLNSPSVLIELEKAVAGRRIDGHEIVVRALGAHADLTVAHVLFVGTATPSVPAMLKSLAGRPILTVGESERFVDEGGTIGFVFDEDKLRFEINVDTAARAKLKISSQLQKLARALRQKS